MRVAVLGAGRMGAARARLLAAHPQVEDVWLAAPELDSSPAGEAEAYRQSGIDEALAARPDAVVVSVATAGHADVLDHCFRLRVPVFCEKPLAPTLAESERLTAQAREAGVPVQVGFQRRFDVGHRAARDAIASGRLGVLYHVRITAHDAEPAPASFIAASGGIFRDMHVHDFDLARWLTGREVESVYAVGSTRLHERYREHGDHDVSALLLTLDDGLPVTVTGTRHSPRGHDVRLEVFGSRDSVGAGVATAALPALLDPFGRAADGPCHKGFADRFAAAFAAETSAFVDFARGRGPSPCPPEASTEALRVAVACERSLASGAAVRVASVTADEAATVGTDDASATAGTDDGR